ncbi:MAG: ImuA family protein [Beijerinckiaceae bacterium]
MTSHLIKTGWVSRIGLGAEVRPPAGTQAAGALSGEFENGAYTPVSPLKSKIPGANCHEFYTDTTAGCITLAGLMLGLAGRDDNGRPILWVRQNCLSAETGWPWPAGVAEFGSNPAQIIFVPARDMPSALQAGLEGARCPTLGAVLIETWGEAKSYDLTASRRLALAAKASGTLVLIARIAAMPRPSAAETRWLVCSVPSRGLAVNAPGHPAFELTLLRARNGQDGLHYLVEWDRDTREFVIRSVIGNTEPAFESALRESGFPSLSGAVVPLPFDRTGTAPDAFSRQRQAG